MSKITFRADEALVERLEALDASKSEVMREALRAFLDSQDRPAEERRAQGPAEGDRAEGEAGDGSIDDALAARVDALIEERLADRGLGTDGAARGPAAGDLTVNVTVDGTGADEATVEREAGVEKTPPAAAGPDDEPTGGQATCGQCGEAIDDDHVYCPNCGEKRSHRAFCDCGDEVRTDWAFCPSCGRRTPAADVLDRT